MSTPLSMQELQSVELNILKAIHAVCEANGLTYYLIAGSVLGAVRHQGFIPWDDDIDIVMPRDDYERFFAEAKNWLPNHLEARNGEQDFSLAYRFGKVVSKNVDLQIDLARPAYSRGKAFVDVYPLDACPDETAALDALRKAHDFYSMIHNASYTAPAAYHGPKRLAAHLIGALPLRKWACRQLLRLHKNTAESWPGSSLLCVGGYTWDELWTIPANFLGKRKLVVFEDAQFWAMEDTHAYLSMQYGDYMTPPPEDKRESTHQITAYYAPGKDAFNVLG